MIALGHHDCDMCLETSFLQTATSAVREPCGDSDGTKAKRDSISDDVTASCMQSHYRDSSTVFTAICFHDNDLLDRCSMRALHLHSGFVFTFNKPSFFSSKCESVYVTMFIAH